MNHRKTLGRYTLELLPRRLFSRLWNTSDWPGLELGRSSGLFVELHTLSVGPIMEDTTLSSTRARELTKESQPQHRPRVFIGPWALHIVNGSCQWAWIMRLAVPITTPPCTFSLRPVVANPVFSFGSFGEAHWVCKSGSWVQNFNTRIPLLPGADLVGGFWKDANDRKEWYDNGRTEGIFSFQ